eukprot:CAMPEP_0185019004 /NCGR_PEP_ID=MMETSP1103-20130426/1638_1 /TAXON_ID=36769 /ORGANISM="Paraphysomonas bandaiensis, Strain Caron Lab Isolate" /LENGTH=546 /DNA_ID=CAMNT_0027549071 /DNA_START=373 /DNA_END=2013 /DNA_ORIENTATION=-
MAGHSGGMKPKLRVGSLLMNKPSAAFTISKTANILQAISHLVDNKTSASLVMDDNDNIIGMFTARDILRFIKKHTEPKRSALSSGTNKSEDSLSRQVVEAMTPGDKMVFCKPTDTVKRCREIMFQLKIRHVPVIYEGEVLGIVHSKDLADSAFTFHDTGGKKGFISNVVGRKGLPAGTRVQRNSSADTPAASQLAVESGAFALPHPFKTDGAVAANYRQYGAHEAATDMSLCEDAYFVIGVETPCKGTQVYACVADGVGSWRQYGIDPRLYAKRLVENAQTVIESESKGRLEATSLFGQDLGIESEALHPYDIIMEAWHITSAEKVQGSSTICVATVDYNLSQLLYSNVGDGGLMVLRHIDSETAGYMRDRHMPRDMRKHDLRVAYLSQQQLRSFNLPFQLGYIDSETDYEGSFESPVDADTASIPVLPGDIIILATDGLFDNVELTDIISIVGQWENKHFPPSAKYPVKGEALKYPLQHSGASSGDTVCAELAETLVRIARQYSLDSSRDSPFAVLAKENDIMWGGGMPDDTSVVVMRVVSSTSP